MRVEFYKHNIDDSDVANVALALRGTFLTTGELVEGFERDLAVFARRTHAVGVTSGTAALHLALAALGIGTGDEVITTPLTFVATANAIVMTGARPVFVDVEPTTGNMDAGLIEAAVTARTKAILPVHLYGAMCDMRAISAIAARRGLAVVEDAAHALEAVRDGVAPGDMSSAAAFSFYATKSITSGEGGAVVTDAGQLAERVRMMRLHGLSRNASERYGGPYAHYDMSLFGWKYNMSNIQAALLVGQLPRVKAMHQRRHEIAGAYRSGLSGVPGVSLPTVPQDAVSAWHLFTIWVDPSRRDEVLNSLQARGVSVAVNYRPVHLMSYYRELLSLSEGSYPNAETIGASTISLPLYPKLTALEVEYVISSVREAVAS